MKFFKKHVLQQNSYEDMIRTELEEARQALLRSETALEWAESNVDYNLSRIERLEGRLNALQSKLQSGEKV